MRRERSHVVSPPARDAGGVNADEDGFETVISMDDDAGSSRTTQTTNGSDSEEAFLDEEEGIATSNRERREKNDSSLVFGPSPEYRGAALRREIEAANDDDGRPPYEGIINELRQQGVRVYIVGHDSSDLMEDVHSVVDVVSRNDRRQTYREKQRCLLYKDEADRVFNLKIKGEMAGLAGSWQSLLLSFSGFEAMIAITVLARAFPCIDIDGLSGVRPGYLSLILGLVLAEEISQVMLNVGMLVQGRPSVSAYALKSRITADWPRKLVVFSLALASATPQDSQTQRGITFVGIFLAELVLLANLGSRAWYHMELNPPKYGGFIAPIVAFFLSVLAGLTVPYLGSRQVLAGGKAAMEGAIRNAILVAIVFVLSDIDEIQSFIVVGSETCSQDGVNFGVGIWFAVSLVTSLWFIARRKRHEVKPEESEPVLEEDHASPLGFKVPDLPDVSVDPDLNKAGYSCCTLGLEFTLGIVVALVIGGAIAFTAFTTKDDELLNREINIP